MDGLITLSKKILAPLCFYIETVFMIRSNEQPVLPKFANKIHLLFFSYVLGFIEVGGFEPVTHRYMAAIPNTTIYYQMTAPNNYSYKNCGIPSDTSFHFFRPADDAGLPWPGVIFGLTISSVWYWCSDQVLC